MERRNDLGKNPYFGMTGETASHFAQPALWLFLGSVACLDLSVDFG